MCAQRMRTHIDCHMTTPTFLILVILDPHRLDYETKMDFHLVLLLLGALAFHPALSDIPEHMVKSLPGWDAPLPTTQYSGYIQVDATKYLHYW